jgi:virginiamycin A acetyltransferase
MWSGTFRELMLSHFNVSIGPYSYGPSLYPEGLPNGSRVGSYCSFGPGVMVFRRNHPLHRMALHPFFYNAKIGIVSKDSIEDDNDNPITVGDDVWIGANAVITPRCKSVGRGAIIGAAAVVTKDVPPYSIMGGNPATQIGMRFSDEICDALEASRWWEHPIEHLTPVLPLFLSDASPAAVQKLADHLQQQPP